MKCEECSLEKEDQAYTDVCDDCVRRTLSKLWREQLGPTIKSFLDQLKSHSDEST